MDEDPCLSFLRCRTGSLLVCVRGTLLFPVDILPHSWPVGNARGTFSLQVPVVVFAVLLANVFQAHDPKDQEYTAYLDCLGACLGVA